MVTLDRYVLEPTAPLHLGGRGTGMESSDLAVRSDTLFSALCIGLTITQGRAVAGDLLDWFLAGESPFLLSSTFPWAGDLFLLPRPRLVARPRPGPDGEAPPAPARRCRWVSPVVLERLLAGETLDGEDGPESALGPGLVWVAATDRTASVPRLPWWAQDEVARVTVDRTTRASTLFHTGRTVFGPDAGLYFLVHWREAAWRPRVEEALQFLADAGLGGERSAGHGQFQLRPAETIELAEPDQTAWRLTLGLYHPARNEVERGALDGAAFDLETRHGWISGGDGSAVWRRAVRMLAEGAIVRDIAGGPLGDLADVTPADFTAHPVFRYGQPLTLAIRPPARLAEGSWR